MACYYITPEAFEELKTKIDDLEYKQLPIILEEVSSARSQGDLRENAEYHAAKDKQRATLKEIGRLKVFKVNAEVINCYEFSPDVVKFGAYVDILDLDTDKKRTIRLVGDYEADINKGFISLSAPLGQALLGKKVGDDFELETPAGINAFNVVSISYEKK